MAQILFIDDVEEILEWMREYLELEGHLVLIASDPREGLRLIQETHPELVILDIAMPRMNGFELLEEARRTHPDLRVIIFSGRDDEEFVERASELGVSHYLHKPVSLDDFKKVISEVLSSSS